MPQTVQLPEKEPKYFHSEKLEVQLVARAAAGDAAAPAADAEPEIWAVLSTETPCDTWFGSEVFSHEKSAIDMSIARNGIALYVDHGGWPLRPLPDPAMHIGHVLPVELRSDRKLWGRLNFSTHPLAQQWKSSALDGTAVFGSIKVTTTRRKVLKAPEKMGDLRTDLVTRWRPEEFSIVGVPADPNSVLKVARAADADVHPVEYEFEAPPATQEESTMPPTEATTTAADPAAAPASAAPAAAASEPAAAAVARSAGAAAVTVNEPAATADQLMALCESQRQPIARARQFLTQGLTLSQAKGVLFDERAAASGSPTLQPAAEARVPDMPGKDRRRYSVARALLQAVRAREGSGKFDGLEGEWSQEIAKVAPVARGGYWIPLETETADEKSQRAELRARAMGTGVAGGGAELVFDQPRDMLDILRNLMLTGRFGAQTVTGLVGNVPFPVQTGDPTAYFVGENRTGGVTQSQLSWVNRVLSAKETAAQVVFSRRLLEVASFGVEVMARRSLLAKHALLWDLMGLHGTGTDGQPVGVYNTPGVGSVAMGGAISFAKVVDLETAIVDANVIAEEMAYITTPPVRGKAKQTLVASAAGSGMIWTGGGAVGEMNGYRAGATKQVSRTLGAGSDHGILFGWWAALVYGFWGALNFMVDDSSAAVAGNGQVVITTNQLGDCLVTRPEAFAVGTGLTG